MMRDLSQASVGRTEFLVHFENAVELRHERPVGGANSACAPVEAALDGSRQRFIPIDGDDEQGGMVGFTGRRPRDGRR